MLWSCIDVCSKEWCRNYRTGVCTVAFTWVGQRQVRHRFLLHSIINPIDMHTDFHQQRRDHAAFKLLKDFLNEDVDLVELEHVLNDMLIHYLRPAHEWNISREHALYAIDNSEVLMRLLRKMREFGRQEEMI